MASTDSTGDSGNASSVDDVSQALEEARAFQLAMFELNLESANNSATINTLQSIADRVAQT